jgi:hypothetical protein
VLAYATARTESDCQEHDAPSRREAGPDATTRPSAVQGTIPVGRPPTGMLNLSATWFALSACTAESTWGATKGEGEGVGEGLLPNETDAEGEVDTEGVTDRGADTDLDGVGLWEGRDVTLRVTEMVGVGVRVGVTVAEGLDEMDGVGEGLTAEGREGASHTNARRDAGLPVYKPSTCPNTAVSAASSLRSPRRRTGSWVHAHW